VYVLNLGFEHLSPAIILALGFSWFPFLTLNLPNTTQMQVFD
jgi:hypothetical protein